MQLQRHRRERRSGPAAGEDGDGARVGNDRHALSKRRWLRTRARFRRVRRRAGERAGTDASDRDGDGEPGPHCGGASSSFLLGPQERQGKSKTRPIWRKWTHANVCLNKLCEPSQISNSYRSFYQSANTKKPPILLLKDLPPWRFGLGHPTQPRAALGRVGVDGASGLSTASAAPR